MMLMRGFIGAICLLTVQFCEAVDFDLYEELGVERGATKAEIKRAFRKQV